eukprot:g52196.t1
MSNLTQAIAQANQNLMLQQNQFPGAMVVDFGVNTAAGNNNSVVSQQMSPTHFRNPNHQQLSVIQFQMLVENQKMQRMHAAQRRTAYARMTGFNMPYFY